MYPRERRRAHRAILAAALERAPPPGWFLDLGGGSGALAAVAERAGYRASVVDPAPAAGARGVFERLPVRDGAVAVAGFVASLHHARDVRAALSEARRALTTRGMLAVALTPMHRSAHEAADAAGTMRARMRAAGVAPGVADGYGHLVHGEVLRDIEAAGFNDLEEQPGLSIGLRTWRGLKRAVRRTPYADFPLLIARAE